MKVLVIEDEQVLSDSIKSSLELEKMHIETASTFATGLQKIHFYEYDCIILDLNLPGGNGLEILKELKSSEKKSNVIIISARDTLDDKLTGLDLGADDYLSKPFHLTELTARLRAVMRRKTYGGSDLIKLNNVKLDANNRQLTIQDKEIFCNRKEFDILKYLMINQNRLVTKSALAEHVWGDHYDDIDQYDFIYYQLKNLRKKLTEAGAEIEISTIYGIGYKLTGQ